MSTAQFRYVDSYCTVLICRQYSTDMSTVQFWYVDSTVLTYQQYSSNMSRLDSIARISCLKLMPRPTTDEHCVIKKKLIRYIGLAVYSAVPIVISPETERQVLLRVYDFSSCRIFCHSCVLFLTSKRHQVLNLLNYGAVCLLKFIESTSSYDWQKPTISLRERVHGSGLLLFTCIFYFIVSFFFVCLCLLLFKFIFDCFIFISNRCTD